MPILFDMVLREAIAGCIDKRSSAELSESINSMFQWYQRSSLCVAFPKDVDLASAAASQFEDSSWFRRGWTLQELLAPREILFCDARFACYLPGEQTKSTDSASDGIF